MASLQEIDPGERIIGLIENGDLAGALAVADAVLRAKPAASEIWRLKAICLLQMGDATAGRAALMRALQLDPQSPDTLCNLASLESSQGDVDAAERALRGAVAMTPRHAIALNQLGALLQTTRRAEEAGACFERATLADPDYATAWLNLANARLGALRLAEAQNAARQALNVDPRSADGWFLLGLIFDRKHVLREAVAAYRRSLDLAPRARTAHNLALVLDRAGAWPDAARMYAHALDLDPDLNAALAQLVFTKRRIGDWDGLDALGARLGRAVAAGAEGVTPFSFLSEEPASARLQLACARSFAGDVARTVGPARRVHAARPLDRSKPLRVGFFAAGYNEHATALLMVEMIERLRNTGIHAVGLSTAVSDGSALRRRIEAAFAEFHDLSARPSEAVTKAVAAAALDILIDIDGYCEGAMPTVFAAKPAPLIVNWLAFPGSLGAPWCDYLIADRFVVPTAAHAFYDEKLAYLPRCFQPNDSTRVIVQTPSRDACGLPATGVVYGCFNNSYKLSPASFARWMEILRAVPDSCLWLLDGPPGSGLADRLRASATAHGIDAQRLVFSPKLGNADYLARFRHMDLFLDTTPYNAHTTASDALWAGCPLLTLPGETFAARVAGSLNHHLGMAVLNAADDAAYIDLAIRAGRDADFRAHLRADVARLSGSSGVFDMRGYASDFAALLIEMAARASAGAPVATIG